jgi:hypothetical protein
MRMVMNGLSPLWTWLQTRIFYVKLWDTGY